MSSVLFSVAIVSFAAGIFAGHKGSGVLMTGGGLGFLLLTGLVVFSILFEPAPRGSIGSNVVVFTDQVGGGVGAFFMAIITTLEAVVLYGLGCIIGLMVGKKKASDA